MLTIVTPFFHFGNGTLAGCTRLDKFAFVVGKNPDVILFHIALFLFPEPAGTVGLLTEPGCEVTANFSIYQNFFDKFYKNF